MRFIFTKMLENQIHYEHTFSTYERKPGTNIYSFQYPEHWLSSSSQHKSVMVRSVRVIPAAREISLTGLLLRRGESSVNISFYISIASNEDMNVLNSKFIDDIKSLQLEHSIDIDNKRYKNNPPGIYEIMFSGRDYRIFYSHKFRRLYLTVISPYMYFNFEYEDDLQGGNKGVTANSDFCTILNLPDGDLLFKNIGSYQASHLTEQQFYNYINTVHGNNINIEFKGNTKEIKSLSFANVWNRSNIIVTSSLSSLSENKYLMMSNMIYSPPKTFEISGYNKGFDINLIELNSQNELVLPADGKDKIVVEMILVAS